MPNQPLLVTGCAGLSPHGINDRLVHLVEAGARVGAIADPDQERIEAAQEALARLGQPPATAFSSTDELIEWGAADGRLDAVVLTLPNALHAQATADALRRGLHVYVAKPLACNYSEAREVVHQAQQSGRVVHVGCQKGHAIVAAMQAVEPYRLGAPIRVHAHWIRPIGTLRSVPARILADPRTDGATRDLGSHLVDALWHIMPARPKAVSAVFCSIRAEQALGPGVKAEDTVIALLRYHEGAAATIRVTFTDHRSTNEDIRIRIDYRDATLEIPLHGPQETTDGLEPVLYRNGVGTTVAAPMSNDEMNAESIRHFIQACRGEAPPQTPEYLLGTSRVLHAIDLSARTDREWQLADIA